MSTRPVDRAALSGLSAWASLAGKTSLLFFTVIKYYFKKKELSSQL
jgi:hypothetical protein